MTNEFHMPFGLYKACCRESAAAKTKAANHKVTELYKRRAAAELRRRKLTREFKVALHEERKQIEKAMGHVDQEVDDIEIELDEVNRDIDRMSFADLKEELRYLRSAFVPGFFHFQLIATYPKANEPHRQSYILHERTDHPPAGTAPLSIDQAVNIALPNEGVLYVGAPDSFTPIVFGKNGELLKNFDPSNVRDKEYVRRELEADSEFISILLNDSGAPGLAIRDLVSKWRKQQSGGMTVQQCEQHLSGFGIEVFLGVDKKGNPTGFANAKNRDKWLLKTERGNRDWRGCAIDSIRGFIRDYLMEELGITAEGGNNFPNEEYRRLLEYAPIPEYVGDCIALALGDKEFSKAIKNYYTNKNTKLGIEEYGSQLKQLKLWLCQARAPLVHPFSNYSELAAAILVIGMDIYMYIKEQLNVPQDFLTDQWFNNLSTSIEEFRRNTKGDDPKWTSKRDLLFKKKFHLSDVMATRNIPRLIARIGDLDHLDERDIETVYKLAGSDVNRDRPMSDVVEANVSSDGHLVHSGKSCITRSNDLGSSSIINWCSRAIPFAIKDPIVQVAVLTDLGFTCHEPAPRDLGDAACQDAISDSVDDEDASKGFFPRHMEDALVRYDLLVETRNLPPVDQRKLDRKVGKDQVQDLVKRGWDKLSSFFLKTWTPEQAIAMGATRFPFLIPEQLEYLPEKKRKLLRTQLLTGLVDLEQVALLVWHCQPIPIELAAAMHILDSLNARDKGTLLAESNEYVTNRVVDFLENMNSDEKAALFKYMAWPIHVMEDDEYSLLRKQQDGLTHQAKQRVLREAHKKVVNNLLSKLC